LPIGDEEGAKQHPRQGLWANSFSHIELAAHIDARESTPGEPANRGRYLRHGKLSVLGQAVRARSKQPQNPCACFARLAHSQSNSDG
jgi:hypothetical protein